MIFFLLFAFVIGAFGRLGEKGESSRALQSALCQAGPVAPETFSLFPTYYSFETIAVVSWNLKTPVVVTDYVVTSNLPNDGTSYTGSWTFFGANAGAVGTVLDSQPPTTFTANAAYNFLVSAPAGFTYYGLMFVPAVDPTVFGTTFTVTLCAGATAPVPVPPVPAPAPAPAAGAVTAQSLGAASEDVSLADLTRLASLNFYLGDYFDPDVREPAGLVGPEDGPFLVSLDSMDMDMEHLWEPEESADFWLGGVEVPHPHPLARADPQSKPCPSHPARLTLPVSPCPSHPARLTVSSLRVQVRDYAAAAAEAAAADGVDVVCATVTPDLISAVAYSLTAFPGVSAISWRLTAPVTVTSYVVSVRHKTYDVAVRSYAGGWTLYGATDVPLAGLEWPPNAAYATLDVQTGTLEAGDMETFPLAASAVAPHQFFGLVFSPAVDPQFFATFNVELCMLHL